MSLHPNAFFPRFAKRFFFLDRPERRSTSRASNAADKTIDSRPPQIHEEFWRGTLAEAAEAFTHRKPRGEITLVVAGVGPDGGFGEGDVAANGADGAPSGADLEAEIAEMLRSGASPSDAARRAAKELGARKKEAYALALRLAGKL